LTYIGQQPSTTFDSGIQDRFTGLSTNTVTLTHEISAEEDILVVWNNIVQDKNTYSVGGTGNKTLTLGGTLVSADVVTVYYLNKVMQSVNPTAGSVNTTQLADLGVTGAKLNTDVISAQTELGSEPADTDEFLVSDGGVIKRVDYSHIKGGGGLVFINQVSSTSEVSNLTLDNVFTSTYTNYLIVGEYTLINGSGPEARILFRSGGSSGSDLTASEYNYHFIRANADGDSLGVNRATGAASCNFTGSTDEDSARVGVRITWTVHDPFDSSVRTTVSGHGKFTQTNGDSAATVGFCDYKGTDSITGIKFYASSDNVKNGHFRVYGIVDS
jgi:hypothetical protein